MTVDFRHDLSALFPPVFLYLVITAFLAPYLTFPLHFALFIGLLVLNGSVVLLSCYLKQRSKYEATHAWVREFFAVQVVMTLLWLFISGYFNASESHKPRTEYIVYYLLVFPPQWLLTLRIRTKLPSDTVLRDDIPEAMANLRGIRQIILSFQLALALVFLFGFRFARNLPFLVQVSYWINLGVNFIVMIYLNHLQDQLVWSGNGLRDHDRYNWYRFPMVLFFFSAGLALLLSHWLPVLSLSPLLKLIISIIRKLARLFLRKENPPEPVSTPWESEPQEAILTRPLQTEGLPETPQLVQIGEILIRFSIPAVLILLLLLPFFRFLFLSRRDKRKTLLEFIKGWRDTLLALFGPRASERKESQGRIRAYNTREASPHGIKKRGLARISRNTVAGLFDRLSRWGEKKGYHRDPSESPGEYLTRLIALLPDKEALLLETGELFNRHLYSRDPLDNKDVTHLKRSVRMITGG